MTPRDSSLLVVSVINNLIMLFVYSDQDSYIFIKAQNRKPACLLKSDNATYVGRDVVRSQKIKVLW